LRIVHGLMETDDLGVEFDLLIGRAGAVAALTAIWGMTGDRESKLRTRLRLSPWCKTHGPLGTAQSRDHQRAVEGSLDSARTSNHDRPPTAR
jgi:hypothetical protein